jgi:ribosomal protein S18 acetylase RimI-like enzyme
VVEGSGLGRTARAGSQELANAGRRVVRLWQADGSARLASIALRLAVSPLLEYGRIVFFVRDLAAPSDWPDASKSGGFEIRAAQLSDLSELVSAGRPDPALAEMRFHRGDQCVVVVDPRGRVLHNRWVTVMPTPIPEVLRDIEPRQDEAYFYDGYTRPDARGLGLDGAVRSFIFDTLRAARFTRVYSYVRGDNRPGLRAASRWQTCVGELWFVCIRRVGVWIVGTIDADDPGTAAVWPELRHPTVKRGRTSAFASSLRTQ